MSKCMRCNNDITNKKYKFICNNCIENEKPLYIYINSILKRKYKKDLPLYIEINGKILFPKT